jgi:putative membrane protein
MYLWIKVLHLLAIISWMAGILYLYRILVNFADHQSKGAEVREVLSGMAIRLYRYITMPAMGVAYIAGLVLIAMKPELMMIGAMHAKLALVGGLTVATIYAGRLAKKLPTGELKLRGKTLRILNEIPTLLMIAIIIFVVVKPF